MTSLPMPNEKNRIIILLMASRNRVSQLSTPYRKLMKDFFQRLLGNDKGELTKKEKQKLAKYLQQSERQVENIFYHGLGSFDALFATFHYCLQKRGKDPIDLYRSHLLSLKRLHSLSPHEREFLELDLPTQRLKYYLALIKASEEIEKKLLKDKKIPK